MTRAELLELLRDAQTVHNPPVTLGAPIPPRGWETLIPLINSIPDLIRLLEEDA